LLVRIVTIEPGIVLPRGDVPTTVPFAASLLIAVGSGAT
jgi:hypothetical protein